jgi:hypothetical protein
MTLRGAHDRIDRAVPLFASRALPSSLRSGGVGDGRMGFARADDWEKGR